MKKLILSCSLLALTMPAYAALDCDVLPTCEELGYAYPEENCEGQPTLKCPFDDTMLYCPEPISPAEKCLAEGYFKGVLCIISLGQLEESCPYDDDYGKCVQYSCSEINRSYFSGYECSCTYGALSTGITGSDGTCYRCGTKTECTAVDTNPDDDIVPAMPCRVCLSN